MVKTNRVRGMWSLNGWVVANTITNQAAVLACKSKIRAMWARFGPGLCKSVRKWYRGCGGCGVHGC